MEDGADGRADSLIQTEIEERVYQSWKHVRQTSKCLWMCGILTVVTALVSAGTYIAGYQPMREEVESLQAIECEPEVWCRFKKCCATDGWKRCLAFNIEYGVTWHTRFSHVHQRTLVFQLLCTALEMTEWCADEFIEALQHTYNITTCYAAVMHPQETSELYLDLVDVHSTLSTLLNVTLVFGIASMVFLLTTLLLYFRLVYPTRPSRLPT